MLNAKSNVRANLLLLLAFSPYITFTLYIIINMGDYIQQRTYTRLRPAWGLTHLNVAPWM